MKKESELPLEEFLKELPPNYLEERDRSFSPELRDVVKEESYSGEGKDKEFTIASDDTTDDEEDTIQEQEKLEKNIDHKQEINELNVSLFNKLMYFLYFLVKKFSKVHNVFKKF